MQKKKSVFQAESFGANPLKVDFDARQQLLSAVSTAWVFFKYNVLIFERGREIDWEKKNCPTSYRTDVTTKQT